MSYWHENYEQLKEDMIFQTSSGDVVKLLKKKDKHGLKWVILEIDKYGWSHHEKVINAEDLVFHIK